ncbi:MAG: hypothetical protein R3F56_14805 [Planctomycetota bacterium]
MEAFLDFTIGRQPNDETCGPTCLQAVYRYHGDVLPLEQIIHEVPRLESGGTLAVLLGQHALKRGYHASLLTYNLKVFDPTWFDLPRAELTAKLKAHRAVEKSPRVRKATKAYLDFVAAGGDVHMRDLTPDVISTPLQQGIPVLAGLSATYLYRTAREVGSPMRYDDLHGEPQGHFVVLVGYSVPDRTVLVADPQRPNPLSTHPIYTVDMDRLVCAIMLGVITFDANLLVLTREGAAWPPAATPHAAAP